MSQYKKIGGVEQVDQFITDFNAAPTHVQKRMVKLINTMLEEGCFLASMNVRDALRDDLWMGNVTQKHQAWRVLFWFENDVVILYRLLTHDQRDKFLRL